MARTLTDLISDLRTRLGEVIEGEWSDTELTRYLNEGQSDVARRTETLQTFSDIPGVIGTQQYDLPEDVVRIYRVEWRPDSGQVLALEYRDFNNLDSVWWSQQTQTVSTPAFFTTWGFPGGATSLKLITYPTCPEAGDFRVFYYKLPTTMVIGSDEATIPAGWENLLILYAEYLALRKDRDPRWQEAKTLYESEVEAMYEMTRRWSDQSGMIVPDVGMGPYPAWLVGSGYGDW